MCCGEPGRELLRALDVMPTATIDLRPRGENDAASTRPPKVNMYIRFQLYVYFLNKKTYCHFQSSYYVSYVLKPSSPPSSHKLAVRKYRGRLSQAARRQVKSVEK